jgi:peptidoglycan/LPS O-acetylase OafA/YrhL
MASIHFRSDINGLRAFAVSAVVLFHFKASAFSGGFVGVDVFFAISGYLMTAIITRRLREGRFNLIGFYGDRAWRIVPPLYAVILSLFIFGYFFIDPIAYQKLGSTGVSALLFFSNFRFWSGTGYFDRMSEQKWLLHTWSLSVEWQFYLIYPIILMALYRFVKVERWRLGILWTLTFLSLIVCIRFSTTNPASTFYLLPFRAWEMLMGGLVALHLDHGIRDKRLSFLCLAIGLALIAFAVFTFDEKSAWPSYWAVIPIVGTCCVIAARLNNLLIFTNPLTRFLGLWSYSIYLWHWPLAVGVRYFDFGKDLTFNIGCRLAILGILIALAVSLLAWRYRRDGANSRRIIAWGGGAGAVLTIVCAGMIAAYDGLPDRMPDSKQVSRNVEASLDWAYPKSCNGLDVLGNLRPCYTGDNKHGTLIIGDSLAAQLYPRYADNPTGRSVTFLTAYSCPILIGVDYNDKASNCAAFVNQAFAYAEKGAFRRIVFISNFYRYFSIIPSPYCFVKNNECVRQNDPQLYSQNIDAAFAETSKRLAALKSHGADIFLVSSTPFSRFDVPNELVKRTFFGGDTNEVKFIDRDALESLVKSVKNRLEAMAKVSGATFVDPADYLCEANRCPTTDQQGTSIMIDSEHFAAQAVKSSRFQFLDDLADLRMKY